MHTYRNSYHNTEARSIYSPDELQRADWNKGRDKKAEAALRRLKKTLCGFSGCQCGNTWGAREAGR